MFLKYNRKRMHIILEDGILLVIHISYYILICSQYFYWVGAGRHTRGAWWEYVGWYFTHCL